MARTSPPRNKLAFFLAGMDHNVIINLMFFELMALSPLINFHFANWKRGCGADIRSFHVNQLDRNGLLPCKLLSPSSMCYKVLMFFAPRLVCLGLQKFPSPGKHG